MNYLSLLLLFIPLSLTASESNKQVELAKELAVIIDAEPIKRVPPKYPITAAKRGVDGWVQLSFVVEPDGSVSNPVVENSSGFKGFEREAMRALKKWKYQPAMENGKPIQQCKNSVQLDFMMARDRTVVSKKFHRLYNKFNEALNEKNEAEIYELASRVKDYEIKTIQESYYKYSILSQYTQYINDPELTLEYLDKAVKFSGAYAYYKHKKKQQHVSSVGVKVNAGESLEQALTQAQQRRFEQTDKNLYPLLHQKLVIELDKGDVAAAYESVNSLLMLDSAQNNYPAYQKQKVLLEKIINSGQPVVTAANIKDNDFWHHELLHNQFQFNDINGELTKLDVRCRNKRHVYTVNDSTSWKLPDNWQGCSIYVYGENNATFNLLEVKAGSNVSAGN